MARAPTPRRTHTAAAQDLTTILIALAVVLTVAIILALRH